MSGFTLVSVSVPPNRFTWLQKLYPWKLECEDYEENLQWEIAVTSPSCEKDGKMKKSKATAKT